MVHAIPINAITKSNDSMPPFETGTIGATRPSMHYLSSLWISSTAFGASAYGTIWNDAPEQSGVVFLFELERCVGPGVTEVCDVLK